ncbi:amidohydrolase family protein [Colwelliaceae bacterium 6441]
MTTQLHTCSEHSVGECPEYCHKPKMASGKNEILSIDMHCHIVTPEVEDVVKSFPQKQGEYDVLVENMGQESVDYNGSMMADLVPKLIDIDVRIQDMDTMGIDIQALSPSPTQYYYWTDRDVSSHIVNLQNERIAEVCANHSDRFVGLGNVSLQFPELAAQQLEYCVKTLGFRGVEISSTVNCKEIADPMFAPFWQKAEELDVVVFLHPLGTTLGTRVNKHYLANLIGVPLETTIALSHMIFGGVLDRYPGLKICAAHGGGFLASYGGRSDHGWQVRPECQKTKKAPSEYLKQIYFDTILFDPNQIEHLVRQVGLSQVVIGTDYPFDMGDSTPMDRILSLPNLSDKDKRQIIGLNAAKLLKI